MNVNRAWWDERAELHGADGAVYDTNAVVAGASTLYRLDHEVVGDVTGLDLVHVQCHIGLDTLSWLRAGARSVTGVDFSAAAVQKATDAANAAGLADRARFLVGDAVELPGELDGRFDVCYASRGVLGWIADVEAWMREAARTLRPDGRLVVIDMHPLYVMVDSVDPLVLDFPYVDDGPQRFEDQTGSYAALDARTANNTTVEYAHSLGEIVTAAADAGLYVEHLGEHVAVETDANRGLATREPDGLLRWRHTGQQLLPIVYSLRARKPAGA